MHLQRAPLAAQRRHALAAFSDDFTLQFSHISEAIACRPAPEIAARCLQ
jgi:hypothetical protein